MLKNFSFVVILGLALVLSASTAYALKIIPPRVVIDSDTGIEYVYIKNNTNKTKTYIFGWKHLAMDMEGKIVNLDKVGMDKVPGYKAADDILRYSPRRVVLQPGDTQRVTLMVRRSPSLEEGEYRSHFFVQQVPDASSDNQAAQKKGGDTTVGVDILVSRSFPVYVMHGEVSASLTLLGATLKKNIERKEAREPEHFVYFDVQKEGNRSIIGVAEVFCGSGEGAVKISRVGKVFAVYAEGRRRQEQVPVDLPEGGCSSPRILIKAHKDDLLSGALLAEGDVLR